MQDPADLPPEELARLDREHVWHPFTQMRDWMGEDPVLIVGGEGNELFDSQGNRYLDAISSLWCNVHGHRRPEIDDAIRAQLDRIAHSTLLGQANAPSAVLAAELVARAPEGLERVFYSDSGSEAVEIAFKIAYQCWRQRGQPKRRKFVAFQNAYHGDTIGSVSLGGIDLFHGIFGELLFEVQRVPAPYCYRCPWGLERSSCAAACATDVAERIRAVGDELAGVVLEPLVQGAAGILTQPEGFLSAVAEATRDAGGLLILDEVATGFGRTGTMFACEQEGVTPDLLCVAKGLTGGYLPLAATLATAEIFEAFLGDYTEAKTFFHGHTYTGNQLACAAALANLEVFDADGTLSVLPEKIERLRRNLEPLRDHPNVGDVRQLGLIVGVELVADRQTREPYPAAERRAYRVTREALKRGVWLRPLGDVVVVFPPLSITPPELDRIADVLQESIGVVCRNAPGGEESPAHGS